MKLAGLCLTTWWTTPELATWEGFADPEQAKLFATAETGDKGQFLAGDPSWVQYDEEIIPNLGIAMQVVTLVLKKLSWLRWIRPIVAKTPLSSTSGHRTPSTRNTIWFKWNT